MRDNKKVHGLNRENIRHFNNAFMKKSSAHFHPREQQHIMRMFQHAHANGREAAEADVAELKTLTHQSVEVSTNTRKLDGVSEEDFKDMTASRNLLFRYIDNNNF